MAVQIGSAYGTIEIGTSGAIQSVQSLSSTLRSIGTTMTAAISAPLIGIGVSAIKSAADFEQSMNVLEQVSGATGEQMAALQAQALQLGADTSFSAGEAAEGMLELAKAGMTAEQTGQAIEGVMSLAAAGNLGLAQAAEIAANAINAFNLPASESGRVADLLAAAANSSSVEVTDMAQSFNMASAVFSSANQSIEDLSTAIAILGNNGLKGSDAGTSLKTMMMRLTAPTKESKKLMDELGISIYDAQGKTRAFPDILADLQQAMTGVNEVTVVSGGRTREQTQQMEHYAQVIKRTKQKLADYQAGVAGVAQSEDAKRVSIDRLNRELAAAQAAYGQLAGIQGTASTVMKQMTEEERNQALAMIFGADAIRAANILIAEGTDEYAKMKDAVTEQGAASEAADARMKGFWGAIERVKGSIDSFYIGTILPWLDSMSAVILRVEGLVNWFGQLSQPVKNAGLAFAAVLAAAGPLMLALSYIGTVLGVLLSPIGLITLAVATLAAAWVGNWGGIQERTLAAWRAIQPVLMNAWYWLQINLVSALSTLKGWWNDTWPALATTAKTVWTNISSAISTAWAAIQPVLNSVYTWLQTNIPTSLSGLQALWDTAWINIGEKVMRAWNTIEPVFNQIYAWLQTNLIAAGAYLKGVWNVVWATMSPVVSTAWGVIQPILNSVYTWLQSNIPTSMGELQALWNTAWPVISAAVGTAWGLMQTAFNTIYAFVTVTIPAGILYLQSWWAAAWGGISSSTTAASSTLSTVWATIQTGWNQLMAIFGPTIENLKTGFNEMIAGFSTMGPEFQALWAAIQPVLQQIGIAVAVAFGGIAVFSMNEFAAIMKNLPNVVGIVVSQLTVIFTAIGQIISGGVALVSAILNGDWKGAWEGAKSIVVALNDFLQGTLGNAWALLGASIQLVGDIVANILTGLGFDAAAEQVTTFTTKIAGLVAWISRLIKGEVSVNLQAPAWLDSLLAWAWPVVGPAVDWVKTLLAWAWPAMMATAEAWVQTLMSWGWPDFISEPSWVSDLFDWDWPDFIASPAWLTDLLGWDWPDLPQLPSWLGGGEGNAGGTSYAFGQRSALNERGRELVSIPSDQAILPPGSRVYTNGQSNRMLAGAGDGGIVINLNGTVINSDRDIHSLANELGSLLKRKR